MNRIVISCLILIVVTLMMYCGSNTNSKPQTTASSSKAPTIEVEQAKITKSKTILFFGNSLTAGLGIDPSDAFAGIIERWIDSLNLDYNVINSGVSGETTAGGLRRIDWILEQQQLDIFILELGGNDGLRGVDPVSSNKNLQGIIDKVKKKYPRVKVILAGMEAPPNMGADYTKAFREMYPKLSKINKLALIPFLLENVGGVPELNQQDGIHPTEKGHQIVAKNIWTILEGLL